MTADQGWLDQMIEQEPQAREQIAADDTFEPHDGQTSDLNLLYTDLLAEPDTAADPFAQQPQDTA